jgi:hypothetical protein
LGVAGSSPAPSFTANFRVLWLKAVTKLVAPLISGFACSTVSTIRAPVKPFKEEISLMRSAAALLVQDIG